MNGLTLMVSWESSMLVCLHSYDDSKAALTPEKSSPQDHTRSKKLKKLEETWSFSPGPGVKMQHV